MSTTEQLIETGRRRRRRHSDHFKAEAIGACLQPGVSVASVALTRGLNANMLRTWVRAAERSKSPVAIKSAVPSVIEGSESFVPVTLPSSGSEKTIRIDVRRRGRSVSIEWPASAAQECALLLRELMR